MKRFSRYLCISLLSILPAVAACGADQLWQKSLDLFAMNSQWHPRKLLVETYEYNAAGGLVSTTRSEVLYRINEQGELKSEILQSVKDGRDITAQQQRRRRRDDSPFMASPFNPALQDSVEVSGGSETSWVGASHCRKYNLSMNYEEIRYSGVAWLETSTGAPKLLVITMETLPRQLDSMVMTFHYTSSETVSWYVKRIVMEGSGTIFFRKKLFRSETLVDGHFIYDPAKEVR